MSGVDPASSEPQGRAPGASGRQSPGGYGACAPVSRRGADEGPPSRGGSHDEPRSGESCRSAEGRSDSLSFRRFSRSVRHATQLLRAGSPQQGDSGSIAEGHATGGAHHGSGALSPTPGTPRSPPSPPDKRTWYDMRNDLTGLTELCRESWLLLLCLAVSSALAFGSILGAWGPTATFCLNFCALIPLAILLGDLTEALSGWCGPTLGGLLNATLGNATEAIVLVQAVSHRLVGVEQAALLGGVLSNTLLVLGMSFIAGGIAHNGGTQYFDRRVAAADTGVLLVATIGVILPTIAAAAPGGSLRDTLADSRATACVLLCMYGAFLAYTLAPSEDAPPPPADVESMPLLPIKSGQELVVPPASEAEEEDEQPSMSFWCILFLLTAVTVLMAIQAGALVTNVFPVSAALNITPDLVSCIFLPIIGNIAEMATAVIAARRGAIDLSLAVALGSSTQISLFLLPMAALFGWAIDVPFTFDFAAPFATAFFAAVVIVGLALSDGESTWLKGCMLLGTYVIFAIGLLTNAGAAGVAGSATGPAAAPAAATS